MAKNNSFGDFNDVEKVFKKFDANGDGKISISELGSILGALGTVTPEEELKVVMKEIDTDVEKVFKKFDANGDGKISISELGSILGALGTVTPEEELKVVMKEIDTDGDGFIDLDEFVEFQRGGSGAADGEATNKELREAFDLYDQNKNGKISATELHSVLKSLGEKCSLKDCRKMIASVDVDGDGSVNFEEFKKMMSK